MKKTHQGEFPVLMKVITPLFACMLFWIQGCGSSSDGGCGGSTFVNQSSQNVTVSANTLSGISFSTFTLAPSASSKVCGNDTDDIMADVTWADGATESKGTTWSGWDGFFCITSSQVLTGTTEADCS